MTDPRNIRISAFDYLLPDSRIAHHPLPERDSSALLIFKNGIPSKDIFTNITRHLPPESLVIFNNTRVVEARLLFQKPTGATIEIFCLEPGRQYNDVAVALQQKEQVLWKCLVGNAAAWTAGLTLEKNIAADTVLKASLLSKEADHAVVQFSWTNKDLSFAEILHQAGLIPLPPYIKRKPAADDAQRYQTIYAIHEGSVAAPTAGLHFTEHIMDMLREQKTQIGYVTLHVGAGTFKPVKADTMNDHGMHAEFIEVKRSLVEHLLNNSDRSVIAVGTTSLRTLESLYWIGIQLLHHPYLTQEELQVQQWYPYDHPDETDTKTALETLFNWMKKNNVEKLIAKTSLLIVPSYQFRLVNILITNFHQPKSTLLLLVAAFTGEKWKSIYSYALDHDFRFLSYGDACLFFRH